MTVSNSASKPTPSGMSCVASTTANTSLSKFSGPLLVCGLISRLAVACCPTTGRQATAFMLSGWSGRNAVCQAKKSGGEPVRTGWLSEFPVSRLGFSVSTAEESGRSDRTCRFRHPSLVWQRGGKTTVNTLFFSPFPSHCTSQTMGRELPLIFRYKSSA